MKPKTLAILAVVALVLVAAAAFSLKRREGAHARVETEAVLLPDLAERVNDVAEAKIEKAGQSATLVKEGDAWVCREASGYPADFEKVRGMLVALARLDLVETMTKDPASHGKLGVDAETGAHVVLRDASGNVAADVVVGEAVYSRGGQRVYARRSDSDQAYLCGGELAPSGDPLTWIKRDILRLDASRPGRIEIAHADGETLAVTKSLPSSPNWDVEGVPPDKSLKAPGIANSMGTALSYLSLDAVKPAAELPLGEHHLATASYRTFDGIAVDVRVSKIEEASWITLSARYEGEAGPIGPAPSGEAGAPAEGEALAAAPEDGTAPPAPPEGGLTPESLADADDDQAAAAAAEAAAAVAARAEELRQEAAELEARLQGWAFQVPQYKADLFLKRMSDLLAEPAPPPEAEETPPAAEEPPAGEEPAPGGDAPAADPPPAEEPAPAQEPPAGEKPAGGG